MVTFNIIDYVVFGVVLLISLGIGVFFSFRQKSPSEYFLGGRKLKLLPVTISITATITSVHSLLGTPAEIYVNGTQYFMHIFGVLLGTTLGGFLFVPLFHPLGLTSVFEYLESRYKSRKIRLSLNAILLIGNIVVNSAGIYGPSVAMHTMTGQPTWLFIVLFGVVTTIYTSIGGMKAVILADVFQAFFIYAGVITVCVLGLVKVGGIGAAVHLHSKWDRLTFFNMNPDPTIHSSFWSSVIGYASVAFCLSHIQPTMQRYCSLPKLSTAKRSMYITAGLLFVTHFFFALSGFAAFAYYARISCDPLRARMIRSPNQILPYFVMEVLTLPGLPGLFVACVACTALSTSSSVLNGCAAVIWDDFMSRRYSHWSEKAKATASKVIGKCISCGLIGIVLAFVIMNIKGTLVMFVVAIAGGLLGPVAGIYVLGAINPKANAKAAAVGFAVSLCFTLLLSVGSLASKTGLGLAPSPISGCEAKYSHNSHNFTVTEDVSVSSLTTVSRSPLTTVSEPSYVHNVSSQILGDRMKDATPGFTAKRAVLQKFFSVSFLYFPLIGLSVTVIVGSLLSLFPYFATFYYVEDKFLFEFVRTIRNRKSRKERTFKQCRMEQFHGKIPNGTPLADETDV